MKTNPQLVYDIPAITTFRELMEHSHARYAERTAFLYREGDEIREVTYEAFYRDVIAFATYLRSRLPQGCKVAVTGKNSYHWVLTYLAVACGVGVIVPIDKDLKAPEISNILTFSESDAVMYSDDVAERIEQLV